MKIDTKKLVIILAGIVILQLIVLAMMKIFSHSNVQISRINKPLFKNLKAENIASFSIADAEKTFVLQKENDQWFVDYRDALTPANTEKVELYLETIVGLTNGIIIESNPNEQQIDRYGFNPALTQTLEIATTNGKTYKLLIGNIGSTRGTSVIMTPSDNKVREIKSGISVDTPNDVLQWTDRRIITEVEAEQISKATYSDMINTPAWNYIITVINENASSEGVPAQTTYSIEPLPEGQLRDYALQNHLRALIGLNVDGYKYDRNIDGLTLSATIKLDLSSGSSKSISIYKNNEGETYEFVAKTDYNDYCYYLSAQSFARIIRDSKDFVITQQ